MSALALSCLIFVLTLGGIFLGASLRRVLPEHHLSKDSQDVVRLGVGLIATIAALVLGLLIASAKSSFDTQSTQITQITADIILLDNLRQPKALDRLDSDQDWLSKWGARREDRQNAAA